MKDIITKIRSRGYWQVTIRPTEFVERRIPDISNLRSILEKTSVRFRGWDFPHVDIRTLPDINLDCIQQEFDWNHIISLWRFCQSGQFFYIYGMFYDWRDQSGIWPANQDWKPDVIVDVEDAIFDFTEIFEFASRLSLTEAGDEKVYIGIEIGNLINRVLYSKHGLFRLHQTKMERFLHEKEYLRTDLVANARGLAVDAANELLLRFNYHSSIESLREWQELLLKRG